MLLLSCPSPQTHGRLSDLTSLAPRLPQVADLVVVQDTKFTTLEATSASIEADLERGAKQVGLARVSAAAARHKRKMCAAFGLVLLLVLVVVVVVEVKSASGGGGGGNKGEATKTETAAAETATAVAGAVVSAARRRW